MDFDPEMAGLLFRSKAVMFRDEGFLLNIHRRYPDDVHIPRSPFYIEFGDQLHADPHFRRYCARFVHAIMAESVGACHYLSDAPRATSPLVALLSDMIFVPMISPRLEEKQHGTGGEIIGVYQPGESVVIIDGACTTGDTFRRIIQIYRRHDLKVTACVAMVNRMGALVASIDGVPFFAGLQWSDMLEYYRSRHVITSEIHNRCVRYPAELQTYLQVHHPRSGVALPP